MSLVHRRHSGHGSRVDHEHTLARAARALESADAEEFIGCATLLFEPFHDDVNARLLLLRAAELFPSDGRPLFWLAKIAVHRECDDELARRYLETALKREPDRPECLSLMVSLLLDVGELEASVDFANRLVERAPHWPNAHAVRGQAMARMGRVAEAEQEYTAALALIQRPVSESIPDSYFEQTISDRRAEPVLKQHVMEQLTSLRRQLGSA